MMKHALIVVSETGYPIAEKIAKELPDARIFGKVTDDGAGKCMEKIFSQYDALIFIGAMGICVRSIAPHIKDKHTDPAVVNVDTTGRYVVSVLSGHVGGANELTKQIARTIGGEAIITTLSDNLDIWPLDTLGKKFNWVCVFNDGKTGFSEAPVNKPITTFVNKKPTALLLETKDRGTAFLESAKPSFVDIYYRYSDIDFSKYDLLIAVTPYIYPETQTDIIYYHPKVLHLGVGCRKNCDPDGVGQYMEDILRRNRIAVFSIKDISTIEMKKDEPLVSELRSYFGNVDVRIYAADELNDIEVPNPSFKVEAVTSVRSVAESSAIKSAGYGPLVLEKQKAVLSEGNDFTFALALDRDAIRQSHIEIVGAGPGDPDLISVKGRRFLESADLILFTGSLTPLELTGCTKQGAVVRSSASMTLEEQFELMKDFYYQGKSVVRLHTGDPCIYGAIQEQMSFFDACNMSYHITPGISSFQAAAAALRSEFTIPEEVQTVILTRAEGRTPVPDREKLHLLARSQSTMCIFLSAAMIENVQQELLEHYPPETPVAVCHKLTWKDEKIIRGALKDLTSIVKENKLTLTTLIVVGKAIDNRQGASKLYSQAFKHLFRK